MIQVIILDNILYIITNKQVLKSDEMSKNIHNTQKKKIIIIILDIIASLTYYKT